MEFHCGLVEINYFKFPIEHSEKIFQYLIKWWFEIGFQNLDTLQYLIINPKELEIFFFAILENGIFS